MDQAWTGKFFGWTVTDPQYRQEEIFTEAFEALMGAGTEVVPSRLVGSGWRTSSSKLLDNAIIGYCREHVADR